MNPAILEAIGMAFQLAFTLMQQQQMDTAAQEKFYQDEKAKFQANKPEDLPDVS